MSVQELNLIDAIGIYLDGFVFWVFALFVASAIYAYDKYNNKDRR